MVHSIHLRQDGLEIRVLHAGFLKRERAAFLQTLQIALFVFPRVVICETVDTKNIVAVFHKKIRGRRTDKTGHAGD